MGVANGFLDESLVNATENASYVGEDDGIVSGR